jgi:hypothetical protein
VRPQCIIRESYEWVEKKPAKSARFVANTRTCYLRRMISELFVIVIWWNALQNYPGLLDSFGYLYGLAGASFAVQAIDRLKLN